MNSYGSLKVASLNGVKVYNVSGGKSLPDWLSGKKKRALRKDADYLGRIELIQDMEFRTAASRIKATPDGHYVVATGVYPPQLRVFELGQLALKFERNLEAEVVDFQILTSDYSKLALLCSDRSIQLHAKFGAYHSIRIPKMGRDLCYDRSCCHLLAAASGTEVYRLDLAVGMFVAPLNTNSAGVNVIGRSPVHGLIACGGEDGAVEFFDLRDGGGGPIARLDAVGGEGEEVTALRFEESESMQLAVGSSGGRVLLFDLRSSAPLLTKDHMYGQPIVDIKWHPGEQNENGRKIISADAQIVKIWDPVTGSPFTSIEVGGGEGAINDVCCMPPSGLILLATDAPRIQNYFIPALGPAPPWCSFLESLTEELEEGGEAVVYDDFKFVDKEELERLNLTSLMGTPLLRAYMHGFFLDARLYRKARAVADPFEESSYRAKLVERKMEEERGARIMVKRKLPKVNAELAARLMAEEDQAAPAGGEKGEKGGGGRDGE